MADEHLPLIEPILSPWRAQLIEALTHVQRDLLLVGPYIKDDVISTLKGTLGERLTPQPLAIRIITRVLPDDFLSGASDIAALQHLLAWPIELADVSVEMRAINNVHAKVWVFDTNMAVVGSGNATFPGLESNLEYALSVADPRLVERILQDWQGWWEQASPVDANELRQLSLWLEAIASDVETRKAEKMVLEKRKAAERRIGTAPRIGNRLVVAQISRRGEHAISERQNLYRDSHSQSSLHAPELTLGTSQIQMGRIHVQASHLWQALRWTTYLIDDRSQTNATNGTFLKITTRPVSKELLVVQFTWADGKRFSQATIQGYAGDTQPSWTITLGESAVQQLVQYLQSVSGEIAFNDQPSSEVYLQWQPSPSHLFVSLAGGDTIPINIPCMPAAMRGNAPMLRAPLSQIVVKQEVLLEGLMSLKQRWVGLQSDAPALTTIEISFGLSGTTSSMTLSVGPIDAPLVVSVPGTDCILSSPEIRLRLDFTSFQHIIAAAKGRVQRWQMRVGGTVEALQFIPEFESQFAWAGSSIWIHELRNVAGG